MSDEKRKYLLLMRRDLGRTLVPDFADMHLRDNLLRHDLSGGVHRKRLGLSKLATTSVCGRAAPTATDRKSVV